MFYWHRILKLLKLHCVWKDFDMRARRPRACALCLIFCKGWWPSQARRRCWSSSRWAQKLPSKPRWIGMSKNHWFWKDSACARGQIFSIFEWESVVFSYVFLTSHLEIVEITECLEGFRHARAAAAAMCTLPYFLQGILEIWLKFGYVRTRNVILYCFLTGKAGVNKTTGSGPPRFVRDFLTKMMKIWLRPQRGEEIVHQGAQQ